MYQKYFAVIAERPNLFLDLLNFFLESILHDFPCPIFVKYLNQVARKFFAISKLTCKRSSPKQKKHFVD
jgi:hypothetical protein